MNKLELTLYPGIYKVSNAYRSAYLNLLDSIDARKKSLAVMKRVESFYLSESPVDSEYDLTDLCDDVLASKIGLYVSDSAKSNNKRDPLKCVIQGRDDLSTGRMAEECGMIRSAFEVSAKSKLYRLHVSFPEKRFGCVFLTVTLLEKKKEEARCTSTGQ